MPICVAGPYSAPGEGQRAANLRAMNEAVAELMRRGHRAMIGVMELSLALTARCEAGLRLGRSPGADREMDLLAAMGRPVFETIDAIPPA